MLRHDPREQISIGFRAVKWLLILVPVSAVIGSACAFFLWSLDLVTNTRWEHQWLLYLLPLAGAAIGAVYHWVGKSIEGGSNLVVEQIHQPGGGIPRRMAPLVLLGTLITHLFGGSAGREGTAVQMGGSIASAFCRWLRLGEADVRTLLQAGVAAGFGAVFGTPLAGAVFAMEVIAIGLVNYRAIMPCLLASVIGDYACSAWGIQHTHYPIAPLLEAGGGTARLNGILLGKVVLAGAAFGLASLLFSELAHSLQRGFKRLIPWAVVRPFAGGAIIVGLTFLIGTRDYLGLGVTAAPGGHATTIQSCFEPGGATAWSWFWKILFTTITISSGFKGGEVTPLFFVGAALGNVLAVVLGGPADLFAGLGFVAVFAGAANTPLACTIMGIELFGSAHVIYLATACFSAYLFSGHSGIYLSQKIGASKLESEDCPPETLRAARELRPPWFRF